MSKVKDMNDELATYVYPDHIPQAYWNGIPDMFPNAFYGKAYLGVNKVIIRWKCL